jgi:hypothetical protein
LLKEYNPDPLSFFVQLLFLRMMITEPELYTRVMNIMNPKNFDRTVRPVAEFMVEHAQKYHVLRLLIVYNIYYEPTQIKAITNPSL